MQENLSISNSKKIKAIFQFISIIFFILLLIPLIVYLGKTYEEASEKNLINGYNQKRFEEFYNTEQNTLDLVFLGSSHSYCTFDPLVFDEKLNIKSFQMGMPLQHPDATYYTLLEILNYQKPKVIVVEVYWDMLDEDFDLKQSDTLFKVLKNEELKKDYIRNVFPLNEKIKYLIKPVRFQNDYFAFNNNTLLKDIEKKYGLKKESYKDIGEEYYRSKGYTYCDYPMPPDEYDKTNQFKGLDGETFVFSKIQKKYLEKIITKAAENEIKVVFVTAPIANVSMEKIKNYMEINKNISEFAEKNNISYLDYNLVNEESNLVHNANFRDDAHLNHSGVLIISEHFSNWLVESKIF